MFLLFEKSLSTLSFYSIVVVILKNKIKFVKTKFNHVQWKLITTRLIVKVADAMSIWAAYILFFNREDFNAVI